MDNKQFDEISVSSSIATSGERRREKLHGFVLKPLLAEVIEAKGGIASFRNCKGHKLKFVLNESKNALFGTAGDRVRRRIQQKVNHWHNLNDKGLYEGQVLKVLGIKPFAERFKSQQKSEEIHRPLAALSDSDSESKSSSDCSLEVPMKELQNLSLGARKKRSEFASPPAKQVIIQKTSLPVTPLTIEKMSSLPALPKNASKFISLIILFITTMFVLKMFPSSSTGC
jgi:hypothetical protein